MLTNILASRGGGALGWGWQQSQRPTHVSDLDWQNTYFNCIMRCIDVIDAPKASSNVLHFRIISKGNLFLQFSDFDKAKAWYQLSFYLLGFRKKQQFR